MKNIMVVVLLATLCSMNVYAGELDGICAEKKTAQTCTVINNTDKTFTQISWLLEGSDVDYGDDVLVTLSPGEQISISNKGEDNCLFTEWTWIKAYTSDDVLDFGYEDSPFTFDADDNCTITLK